jgi:hypothetical protein
VLQSSELLGIRHWWSSWFEQFVSVKVAILTNFTVRQMHRQQQQQQQHLCCLNLCSITDPSDNRSACVEDDDTAKMASMHVTRPPLQQVRACVCVGVSVGHATIFLNHSHFQDYDIGGVTEEMETR